jgi:hypothetical protein
MLLTCQSGFEALLSAEVSALRLGSVDASGAGWIRIGAVPKCELPELCFAHRAMIEPAEIVGDSVNALAGRLCEWFMGTLRGEKIEGQWPSVWQAPIEIPGLGKRLGSVESEFNALLKKRLSRVAKLASPELPRGTGSARGLFVFAPFIGRLSLSRDARLAGSGAWRHSAGPSRSYQKTEEALSCSVANRPGARPWTDLGSAPGGWSTARPMRGRRRCGGRQRPAQGRGAGQPANRTPARGRLSLQAGRRAAVRLAVLRHGRGSSPRARLGSAVDAWPLVPAFCRESEVRARRRARIAPPGAAPSESSLRDCAVAQAPTFFSTSVRSSPWSAAWRE